MMRSGWEITSGYDPERPLPIRMITHSYPLSVGIIIASY